MSEKKSIVYSFRFPPQDFKMRLEARPDIADTLEPSGEVVRLDEDAFGISIKRAKNRDPLPPAFSLIPTGPIGTDVLRGSIARYVGAVLDRQEHPKNRAMAFFSVLLFLSLYVALTWYIDYIQIACFVFLLISLNDWRTRHLIETGIGRYFSEKQYDPHPGDKDYRLIRMRRVVARKFLFKRPHLRKETARVIGCGIALTISVIAYFLSMKNLDMVAYVILILTLITNEFVSVWWRLGMWWKMLSLENAV